METDHHQLRNRAASRENFSARTVALFVLVVAAFAAGSYLYLVPGVSAGIPSSCSVSPPSLPVSPQSCPAGLSAESSVQPELQSVPCSQEMVDLTSSGDTLFSLLHSNLLDEAASRKVASNLASEIQKSLGMAFDTNTALQPGRRYSVTIDQNGDFLRATLELDPANVFHAAMEDCSLRCWKEEVVLDYKTEAFCFKMKGNLVDSVMSAGEGAELAMKVTNVFRWDIDFQSESMRGDTCRLLFERRFADDRPSGYGSILCAVYEGRKTGTKTAILFNNEYYDVNGLELKKNFLRSPLSVIRVTSRYGQRFHPILRVWRKHCGVDYGAAKGTPVYSVAGGTVTFCGWQNGYGNHVCIKHDNGYESRYGHLHRFLVQKGQRVKQRDKIGLVGQTGDATGPHLDFQLLVKGNHVNPLSVKMVQSLRTIASPLMTRFTAVKQGRLTLLGNAVPSPGSDQRVAASK